MYIGIIVHFPGILLNESDHAKDTKPGKGNIKKTRNLIRV